MMQFQEPMNDETAEKIEKMFGPGVPMDARTALINDIDRRLDYQNMKEIANTAKQPVTISVVHEGEIKTLSDGTQYQVTPRGWIKLEQDRDV